MKKIVSIVGARPQFIKCKPLSKELRKYFTEIILHTGQHYDEKMSKIFFEQLGIPEPDYNLGVGSGLQGEQTGKMLIKIEKVLIKEKPDLVIIYGDTNSTMAGALAASKLNIRIAHIEAGLRSFKRDMPEEINRIVSDHLSDFLFVPSKEGMKNLKNEGLIKKAFLVGDIMYDAVLQNIEIALKKSKIIETLNLKPEGYYLCTIHRASNTDNKENLKNILEALSVLDKKVIFPIHPRTEKFIRKYGLKYNKENIIIIEPVGYLDMLILTRNCFKVLTDSGGLQKEAFYLGKEVVVLREESEWKELVDNNVSFLAGVDKDKIVKYAKKTPSNFKKFFPYGKGDTAIKIVKILKNILK